MTQTGAASTDSPRAARSNRSFFRAGKLAIFSDYVYSEQTIACSNGKKSNIINGESKKNYIMTEVKIMGYAKNL